MGNPQPRRVTVPSTKRVEAKAATRAKLLAAAREAFQRDGYEKVTIRSIAKDIGMSTGAIFGGFDTKADLFRAAIGEPAPDIGKWLLHVATCAAEVRGDDERAALLTEIADDAMKLRARLLGIQA